MSRYRCIICLGYQIKFLTIFIYRKILPNCLLTRLRMFTILTLSVDVIILLIWVVNVEGLISSLKTIVHFYVKLTNTISKKMSERMWEGEIYWSWDRVTSVNKRHGLINIGWSSLNWPTSLKRNRFFWHEFSINHI